MKPIFCLLLMVLFWQCNSPSSVEPTHTEPIITFPKRIVYSGITLDFQYENKNLSAISLIKGTTVETLTYTRLSDGRMAKVTARRNGSVTAEQTYEIDNKGRIVKIAGTNGDQFEYQYDGQGKLTKIIDQAYGMSTSLQYTGGNLSSYAYDFDLEIPPVIENKAVTWDDRPNPVHDLNAVNGWIFPVFAGLYNTAYLGSFYNVFSQNNLLNLVDNDSGVVIRKYEYEYRNGLPIQRKTFYAQYDTLADGSVKPNGNFKEDSKELVLYDY